MQCIGQTVEDFGQPLHGALHVAQQDVEALEGRLTRLLRSWSLLLERSWSREIAGTGKFVGVEAVIRVEVEAPGPDGTLEGRAWTATTAGRVRDGELSHATALLSWSGVAAVGLRALGGGQLPNNHFHLAMQETQAVLQVL